MNIIEKLVSNESVELLLGYRKNGKPRSIFDLVKCFISKGKEKKKKKCNKKKNKKFYNDDKDEGCKNKKNKKSKKNKKNKKNKKSKKTGYMPIF